MSEFDIKKLEFIIYQGERRRAELKNLELWEFFRHILESCSQLELFERDMQEQNDFQFIIDSTESDNAIEALKRAIERLKKNPDWKSKVEIEYPEWSQKGWIQGSTPQEIARNELERILKNLERTIKDKAIVIFKIK